MPPELMNSETVNQEKVICGNVITFCTVLVVCFVFFLYKVDRVIFSNSIQMFVLVLI